MRWESDGAGEFTIEMIDKAARGTEITLHLREGQDDLLSGWKLRSIIRKYSDHIVQPIVMKKEEFKDGEQVDDRRGRDGQPGLAPCGRGQERHHRRQYKEFYKHVGHDFEEPLTWPHARVEGKPGIHPAALHPGACALRPVGPQARHGVKLYVRRVFIMDDAEQLMPVYLRFVRGVVDSNDLPLNVSREILQESKDIEAIRNGCITPVLGLLEDLAREPSKEKYAKFWGEFGRVLKEGVGEDFANRTRSPSLLRFASTHADTDGRDASRWPTTSAA